MTMNEAVDLSKALAPFLAAVVVGIVSLLSVRLGNRLGAGRDVLGHTLGGERDVRAKEVEAGLRRRQRWEEFEESTLIEFQDQAAEYRHSLMKFITCVTNLPFLTPAESMKSIGDAVPDYIKAESVLLNLCVRIHDEETRSLAKDFFLAGLAARAAAGELAPSMIPGRAFDQRKVDERTQTMLDAFMEVSGKIGEKIREKIRETIESELKRTGA